MGNITEVVDDPDDIPETIIKVSAFSRRGTGAVIEHFRERWGEIFQVAVAGDQWIDFTLADKGSGLSDHLRSDGSKTGGSDVLRG